MLTRRSSFFCLLTILVLATAALVGCGNKKSGEAYQAPLPTLVIFSTDQPTAPPSETKNVTPTIQSTPTPFILEPLFDPNLDLKAGPIEVPFELQIPSLKVNAPVLGVGLVKGNVMDAPTGPIDDPVWNTAFWYRGSSIPGEPGTATIGGHITNPVGQLMIFGHLNELRPGDLIIVHNKNTAIDIHFYVDNVKVYTIEESSDPVVLAQIFGPGPILGDGPQPALDGLSHLTLITCGGDFIDGKFDSHTVVYATRNENNKTDRLNLLIKSLFLRE